MQQRGSNPGKKKPGRVSLPPVIAPTRGSPFAGVSNTHAPARNTAIPNLTEHVAVAKAKVQALKDAGLTSEAKREATAQAQTIIAAAKPEPKRTAFLPPAPRTPAPTLPASLTPKTAAALTKPRVSTPPPPTHPPAKGQRRGAPSFNELVAYANAHPEAAHSGHFTLPSSVTNTAKTIAGYAAPNDLAAVALPPGAAQALHGLGLNATTSLAKASTKTAEKAAGLGTQAVGKAPTSFDVVPKAGAATIGRPVTKDELKQLEQQGYDLAPELKKKFTAAALKNGWNAAEIDGISGSALIDKAFTKPGPLPLRILANTASGVAKLGTLPAGVEGAIRETAAGHGAQVAQALGQGLYSELPVVGKHKAVDTAIADPFGFFTQFAGAGKTVGTLGRVSRIGKAGEAARIVKTAGSGLEVNRGTVNPNAYVAAGNAISDKAASTIPRIGQRLEAEVVDKSVRRLTNKHAPAYVAVQRPYKAALDKVGRKRAAELSGFQMSGGKPEQLAAFYRSQGQADAAKFFDKVAANTKTLSPQDKVFLDAHAKISAKTSEALQAADKFGPTAAEFRRYSPLIRSSAHLGNPEAQRILALRDEYIKGFNAMPEQDLAALRGAIDQGVADFATKHMASPSESVGPGWAKAQDSVRAAKKANPDPYGRIPREQEQASQTIDHPRFFYHQSNVKNRESIGATGLEANRSLGGKKTRVYLDSTHQPPKPRSDTAPKDYYKIDTQGMTLRPDPEHPERWAISESDIPPDRIRLIHTTSPDHPVPPSPDFVSTNPITNIEPAYVEYGKPKPVVANPFTPGPGGTYAFKTPKGRQKVETGASFESGKYLIDPTSPLVQNVRAQRQHLASILHEDVSKAVGTHVTAGAEIPPGHVFVSETNLRGLKRTVNDLADNPVSAPDYEQLAAHQQGIFDRLKGVPLASSERVPRGEKGYAVPLGAWKRILDHTRPSSKSAYAKFMRQYQRVLVSYRPSTIVNNTIGSLPLAMTAGAGPKSFKLAAQAMKDPTLAPAVLRSHGIAGSFAPSVRSHVGAGLDFMRAQSAKGEDFSRLATFFSKAGPTIKKRAAELNQTTDEYARAFAAGKVDEPLLDKALDHTEAFIGDMLKPDGALARKAGGAILFHNWVGHIAKLLLYTLPVNHPRRLNLLLTLSAYGDQYRQQHGVWPDWYAAYLPLFQEVKRVGPAGVAQTFTKSYSTQGVNPFSTLNNFAAPVSTNESAKNIIAGLVAPPLQIPFNAIANRPYDSTSVPRYVAGQIVRQIPGVTVVRPQGGMASDSIPFISEKRKTYSSGRKLHGKSIPLPWDLRAGARAEGGILGGLERYLVGGVYDVPAQGPIHSIDQKKHIGAMAKAARKSG